MNLIQKTKSGIISLVLGITAALLPIAASAAERITFNFPPFGQFYIKVDDLEAFATRGEISSELAFYLNRLPPNQVARLPLLLSTPLEFNPLTIAKFSNSTIGEAVIANFGKGIRADVNHNGFFALRGAIIAAAFDREGLTVIKLLQEFPLDTIYMDLQVLEQYFERGEKLLKNREAIATAFFQTEKSLNQTSDTIDFSPQIEVKNPGKYTWNKQTFTYNNSHRPKPGYFDLYLPEINTQIPLIVISHGVASNRQTFAYLGQHLASHGFAVAVTEHDDISFNKFDAFLSGEAKFPEPNNLIDQPLDVKFVLDRLEQESQTNPQIGNKINLQQVGLIGQSFGGYTALALAGGKLLGDKIPDACQDDNYQAVLLDLSSLAQCTFNKLPDFDKLPDHQYELRDPRIKAVIAINPLGKLFGRAGISSIKIPTMLISGTHDLMTPPVAEQIEPFTWLNPDLAKYLVLIQPGTHFSFLQSGLGVLPVPNTIVGPDPDAAHPALKALSTAFFRRHLTQQPEYEQYLTSDRLKLLNNDAFKLSIVRSLTKDQLKIINNQ